MCALRYRADTQVGPYNRIRDDDNTVKMIRHDHKFVRLDYRNLPFNSNHHCSIMRPASFNNILPACITPNKPARSSMQIVTRDAPTCL